MSQETIKKIARKSITSKHEENVRLETSYALDGLILDIAENGQQTPIMVCRLKGDKPGTVRNVRGFRRYDAVTAIVEQGLNHPAIKKALESDDYSKADKDQIISNVKTWQEKDEILAIDKGEIEPREYYKLMADRGQDKPFKRAENYELARRLSSNGFSQTAIANMLGIARGTVQEYVDCSKMPAVVYQHMFADELGLDKEREENGEKIPPILKLTNAQVRDLYTEFLKDKEADKLDKDGELETPAFSAKLTEMLKGSDVGKAKRLRSPQQIQNYLEHVHHNQGIKDALKWVLGEDIEDNLRFDRPVMTKEMVKQLEAEKAKKKAA